MAIVPEPLPPSRRELWPRLLLLSLIAAVVASFYLSGLHRTLTWEYVQTHVHGWQQQTKDHLVFSALIFFVVYLTATALSLPLALLLSLVGGALFGRWLGAGLVSLASTSGACLAFLGSRYLFRDWVRRRFGKQVEIIDRGVEKDGAWYLLTLRLLPIVPFFLVNLSLALTPMRLSTFALVSWLGMLPATLVITNAGTAITSITTPSDVLSLEVLGSLALLGLLPLFLRFVLLRFKQNAPRV